jgi:hypothetical protein
MSKFFGSSQVLYRGMRTRLRKSRTVHAAFRLAAMLVALLILEFCLNL